MSDSLVVHDQRPRSAARPLARRYANSVGLAVAVGVAYFLVAYLSLTGLFFLKREGVAAFWPAAGISAGVLIALGRRARWPVVAGVFVAVFVVVRFVMVGRNFWLATVFALCDVVEPLIIAGVIARYFGTDFALDRLRNVAGLMLATLAGTIPSSLGAAVASRLVLGPSEQILTTWGHWWAGVAVGVVTVAPLVIGLLGAMREPPPRSELVEGVVALLALAAMTAISILLPQELWETVVPGALLFPILVWLAARCRPVFAAAGALMLSLAVAWTTIFNIGHFGDTGLPIDYRILQAQAIILVAAIGSYVLAALFAERRESEARLARSNAMLRSERDNKLMNLEAMAASISHELKQPLAAIAANAGAGLRWLKRAPPDLEEARSSLNNIADSAHGTSRILDNLRTLFGKVDRKEEPVDVNEVALASMRILHGELSAHRVKADIQLASELPLIMGQRVQLQEVFVNLVRNAIEAMDAVEADRRALVVRTKPDGSNAIIVEVKDSGPGISSEQLRKIFGAFVTTKPNGMGLGLAICRAIVERHGGQLSAISDVKDGTLFSFFLPMKPMDKSAARAR